MLKERWKPVVGWENLYEVSDRGRVKRLQRTIRFSALWKGKKRYTVSSTKPEKILSAWKRKDRRRFFTFEYKGRHESRLAYHVVLEAFVGPCPSKCEACHNNGDPSDDRLTNLRWGTRADNQYDRKVHGTGNQGVRHGMAKLSNAQVIKIRNATGTQQAIADRFGISRVTVSFIRRGIRWSHL